MANSDQENTAENDMAKAVGCVMGIGGVFVALLIGAIVLAVRIFSK